MADGLKMIEAKAISLWQPWASLMAHNLKKIETRSRRTNYRGPVAIHAAKKIVPYPNMYCQVAIEDELGLKLWELPRGSIVAVCDLLDCQTIMVHNRPDFPERHFGDYTPGRFMWITENVKPLKRPVPMRGYPWLWGVALQPSDLM